VIVRPRNLHHETGQKLGCSDPARLSTNQRQVYVLRKTEKDVLLRLEEVVFFAQNKASMASTYSYQRKVVLHRTKEGRISMKWRRYVLHKT
jgi:hypothetical protein